MKSILVPQQDVLNCLSKFDINFEGQTHFPTHFTVSSLNEAEDNSIVWFNGTDANLLAKTKACLVICTKELVLNSALLSSKTFVRTSNPKLLISQVIADCFAEKPGEQIHPTAFIHPEAKIGKNAFIGPFVYIGKAEIGDNATIWGHAYVHNNVTMGDNVEIHAGCVIGEIGSGFTKDESGEYVKFPHIGGVIIEDNVEVGALSYINRGSLSDTIIKRGAKIGNAVCIGHNVYIGEHSMVIANSVVAGSTKIGKNCWIAHSCSLRNGITLGDNVFIGMGSVVTGNCESNTTLYGNPAKDKEDHKKWRAIQQDLLNQNS